jgi:hypothetical protein
MDLFKYWLESNSEEPFPVIPDGDVPGETDPNPSGSGGGSDGARQPSSEPDFGGDDLPLPPPPPEPRAN